jgi:outer membrane receptor protein involved in Fe transport
MSYQTLKPALLCLIAPAIALSAPGQDRQHEHDDHAEEVEEIIVQATRSRRRIQDEAIRVEVLSGEEIEEKLLMRPGNISMMLNETGGLRVQVTSPALGSANVRIYGMRGRYTQLLADGLPLYGGQASSLGLLQVPPSDLGQVEIIKGSASALYGGQSLGGVINLVSKRPGADTTGEVILNATTRDAQDASAYVETALGRGWSGSLLTNYNRQSEQDLDNDNWIDMPGYERVSARPRLYYGGHDDFSAYLTLGAMSEDRRGGTEAGGVVPDGEPFQQNQDTRRFDAGLVLESSIGNWGVAQLRASGMRQSHDHRFGDLLETDQHETTLVEASLAGDSATRSWVAGLAYQSDAYESETFPVFDYNYDAPAIFGQVDQDLAEDISLAASVRWDDHSEYGDQFSPRVSLLYRPGPWTVRGSWGRGFYAPTPFIEETEAAGLSRLDPLAGLVAETAETLSLDIGYAAGAFETGLTFFGSDIDDAVQLQTVAADRVQLVNQRGVTRTRGIEGMLRWRQGPYVVTGSYLYLDADEPLAGAPGNRTVPLTPRHSAGIVAMWEQHDRGRVGLELYYTGKQTLADNPFRDESEPYLHIGLLGEVVLGQFRLFLNLENLLNVRQTKEDPLVRPSRAPSGLWTVDAWGPLEGFIANAGIRMRFGSPTR